MTAETTRYESVSWCKDAIRRNYTPAMARALLEKPEARKLLPEVVAALIEKAAEAEYESADERRKLDAESTENRP